MTIIKIAPIEECYAPEGESFTFVSATTLEPSFPIPVAKTTVPQQSDFTAEDLDHFSRAASRPKISEPES